MAQQTKTNCEEKTLKEATSIKNATAALYQPLNNNGEEIRLVTLQKGEPNDEIQCNLSKVSLNELPSYQALSYTWGDPNSTLQIYLDGRPHQVTTNLESALRHLRLATESRVLWIDALCINQRDILERNSQVMHMNSVYQKASEVIIWLGEEAGNSHLAFDAFEMLPKVEAIHWDLVANPTLDKVLCDRRYALAVEKLFQRSWWHRVWTVQESILGERMKFVCGSQQISADTLFAVEKCYHKHVTYCCDYLLDRDGSKYNMHIYTQPMSMLELLRTSRKFWELYRIFEMFALYRSRGCTDPRDKIYGLLGIIKSEEVNLIIPDYLSPVSMVYEQTALKMINHFRNLDIFSQICPRSRKIDRIATAGLPSWVPDWTSGGSHTQFICLFNRLRCIGQYRASNGNFAHVKLVAPGKITLRGIFLSSCGRFSEPNDFKYAYNNDLFKGWRDLITNKLSLLYANTVSTRYYDVYWQTLCASVISQAATNEASLSTVVRTSNDSVQRSWHDNWWRVCQYNDLRGEEQMNPEVERIEIRNFVQFIVISTAMRRLFISKEDELLGLAPMDAEVGDRIALLEGGSVPYILRPKFGRKNEWEIIGDAYVHGIMDGEAWKPDQLIDIVLV